jgi:hypothetical protein
MPNELKTLYAAQPMPDDVRNWMMTPATDLWSVFCTVHHAMHSMYNMQLHTANPVLWQYMQHHNLTADLVTVRERYT